MAETRPTPSAVPKIDASTRVDVVAASIAVLVRQMQAAGMEQAAAFRCLADAPDKIEAALTRGKDALVIYRLDGSAARGIVSDRDDELEAFAQDALRDGAPMCGLNPWMVASMVLAMRADGARAALVMREGADAQSTVH